MQSSVERTNCREVMGGRVKQLLVIVIGSAASLAIFGCALTVYGPELNTSFTYRDQTIQGQGFIKDIFPEAMSNVSVLTHCSGLIPYTMMMSPIIPLPPIIPMWFARPEPDVILQIDTTRSEDIGCYLTVKQGNQEYEVFPHRKIASDNLHLVLLHFKLRGACLDINGTEIRVHGIRVRGQPTISEPIRININPRNEFGFGYGGMTSFWQY